MVERTVNWLIYTCLLGLLPVLARLFVWTLSNKGVDPVAVGDLVAFGLVLQSANISEVNRSKGDDPIWQTVNNGASVLFIAMYGLLMFAAISLPENINQTRILYTTIALSVVSFLLTLSVFLRLRASVGPAT